MLLRFLSVNFMGWWLALGLPPPRQTFIILLLTASEDCSRKGFIDGGGGGGTSHLNWSLKCSECINRLGNPKSRQHWARCSLIGMSFGHRGRSEEDPHLVIEQGLRELCRLDTGTAV